MPSTVQSVQLFSIGNALVDQEYSVDESFLQRASLQKGTMQLVSLEQQQELLDLLQDYTHQGQASGGSAANTTVGFSALGGSSFYACRVGNDELGQFYLNDLTAAQVQTTRQSLSQGKTGRCLVLITPDGERTMCTYLGITGKLSRDQIDFTPLTTAQWLYIEGYLATSATAQQAVIEARQIARQHQVKIAISLSDPAMVQYAKTGLDQLIGDGVDVLFCNEQEALMYSGASVLEQAAERLSNLAETVAITLGAEGALVWVRGQAAQLVPTHPTTVKDTNGAGDGFAAGFLYALTQGQHAAQAAILGHQVAGAIVAQYGPRLAVAEYRQMAQQLK